MYRQKWASIVYGRSYHLDFRYITIPEDFTNQELNWATPYIVATTRKARKLPAHPRWSLFKNDSHCVVGVTCMVRELIGYLEDNSTTFTKDDSGRPLYIFVGYVTKLERQKHLFDLPSYTGDRLEDFQSLYQYVQNVWLVKNFNRASRQPQLSQYQKLTFAYPQEPANIALDELKKLNHQGRAADRVFLWRNTLEWNRKLWTASANFPEPISICLGINGKRWLNSPFLNQTISEITEFTIENQVPTKELQLTDVELAQKRSLPQFIAQRAKEDLNLTLHHAAQAATLGQELLDNFTDWTGEKPKQDGEKDTSDWGLKKSSTESVNDNTDNFGLKSKPDNQPATKTQDWF